MPSVYNEWTTQTYQEPVYQPVREPDNQFMTNELYYNVSDTHQSGYTSMGIIIERYNEAVDEMFNEDIYYLGDNDNRYAGNEMMVGPNGYVGPAPEKPGNPFAATCEKFAKMDGQKMYANYFARQKAMKDAGITEQLVNEAAAPVVEMRKREKEAMRQQQGYMGAPQGYYNPYGYNQQRGYNPYGYNPFQQASQFAPADGYGEYPQDINNIYAYMQRNNYIKSEEQTNLPPIIDNVSFEGYKNDAYVRPYNIIEQPQPKPVIQEAPTIKNNPVYMQSRFDKQNEQLFKEKRDELDYLIDQMNASANDIDVDTYQEGLSEGREFKKVAEYYTDEEVWKEIESDRNVEREERRKEDIIIGANRKKGDALKQFMDPNTQSLGNPQQPVVNNDEVNFDELREALFASHEAQFGRREDVCLKEGKFKEEIKQEDMIRDSRINTNRYLNGAPLPGTNTILGVNGTPAAVPLRTAPVSGPINMNPMNVPPASYGVQYNPLPYQQQAVYNNSINLSGNRPMMNQQRYYPGYQRNPFTNPYSTGSNRFPGWQPTPPRYEYMDPERYRAIMKSNLAYQVRLDPYNPDSYSISPEDLMRRYTDEEEYIDPLYNNQQSLFGYNQYIDAKKQEEDILKRKMSFVQLNKSMKKACYSYNNRKWTEEDETKFNEEWHDFLYPPKPKELTQEEKTKMIDAYMIENLVPVNENNRYEKNLRDLERDRAIHREMQGKWNPPDIGFVEWMNEVVPEYLLHIEIERILRERREKGEDRVYDYDLYDKELKKFSMKDRLEELSGEKFYNGCTLEGVDYPDWWDFDAFINEKLDGYALSARDSEYINNQDEVREFTYYKAEVIGKNERGVDVAKEIPVTFRGTIKEFMTNEERRARNEELLFHRFMNSTGIPNKHVE